MDREIAFEIILNKENEFRVYFKKESELCKLIGRKIRIINVILLNELNYNISDCKLYDTCYLIFTSGKNNLTIALDKNDDNEINRKIGVNKSLYISNDSIIHLDKNELINIDDFKIKVEYLFENDNNIDLNINSNNIINSCDYLLDFEEEEESEDEEFLEIEDGIEESEVSEESQKSIEEIQNNKVIEKEEISLEEEEENYEDLLNEANELNEDILLYESDDQINQLFYGQNNNDLNLTNNKNNINNPEGKKYLLRKTRRNNKL